MSDEFDMAEAQRFIETQVSPVHRALALKALNADDAVEIEQIGLLMAGEQALTGFVLGTGATPNRSSSLWAKIIAEVYDFFCTTSETYDRERKQGVGLFEQAVTVIATAIGSTFTLGAGLITGLVTVAVLAVAKMGKNAWCKWTAEQTASQPSTSPS